ncbi:hypothetical protein ACT8ZV_17465 [Nocardioides sp. MAHUQ-72]|uniref:hypothetical protein n=1 Tax=unclassified Nocardioides TaxID=2615069 RepID=UPI00360CE3F4
MRARLTPARARLPLAAAALLSLPALVAVPPAAAATVQQSTWSYDPVTNRLVGSGGELPFTLQGGTAVVAAGAPAVRFTKALSLATWTGDSFPAPGTEDFTWTAVMSMDRLNARSTPNVAQFGLYDAPQIKLQLSQKGVPQCVFNGTGGRLNLTSGHASLNDGGAQHTFSCWRRGTTLGVTVDSLSTSTTFDVGSITPTGRPTIGNRTSTGSAKDQLFGKFWSLRVTIGS